jgi:hypothetical protein
MRTKYLLAVAVIAASLTAQAAQPVSRSSISSIENTFDARIQRFSVDEPLYLLGATRGVYLEGFGILFSADVDLMPSAAITPFHQSFTKEEKAKIRLKKLERVVKVKELARELLIDAAAKLETIPADEQIAVAITVLHKNWEDTTGLPAQIVIVAPRKALLEYKNSSSKTKAEILTAALKVREY